MRIFGCVRKVRRTNDGVTHSWYRRGGLRQAVKLGHSSGTSDDLVGEGVGQGENTMLGMTKICAQLEVCIR